MLEFSDAPYQFFPSKPSRPIIALSRWVNRKFILPNKTHRIAEVALEGAISEVKEVQNDPNSRILFVANHPSHSDPQTFTEVQRQLGVSTCFMAAYDIFLRSKLNAWIIQRNGAFSIDRESTDRKAMSAAVDILKGGDYGLSIFPEGNVHLTNDRVTPFLDGAAFIGVRAQKSLAENATVYAVPIAMKFSHLSDARGPVRTSLGALAESVGEKIDHDKDPVEELLRIGRIILVRNLTQRGFLTSEEGEELLKSGCLFESLKESALQIVTELEDKIDIGTKDEELSQNRIRRVRSAIHQVLSDPDRQIDHAAADAWAKEALLVLRILGYSTPYASENATLDRFSETVEKLNEDLYNRITPKPFGKRIATARICQPINISSALAEASGKTRNAVNTLTDSMESSIQSALDSINQSLSTEGSKPFSAS